MRDVNYSGITENNLREFEPLFFGYGSNADKPSSLLSGDDRIGIGVTVGEEAVAAMLLWKKRESKGRSVMQIEWLYVEEPARRQGIGSRLLRYAEKLAKLEGCSVIRLSMSEKLTEEWDAFLSAKRFSPSKETGVIWTLPQESLAIYLKYDPKVPAMRRTYEKLKKEGKLFCFAELDKALIRSYDWLKPIPGLSFAVVENGKVIADIVISMDGDEPYYSSFSFPEKRQDLALGMIYASFGSFVLLAEKDTALTVVGRKKVVRKIHENLFGSVPDYGIRKERMLTRERTVC